MHLTADEETSGNTKIMNATERFLASKILGQQLACPTSNSLVRINFRRGKTWMVTISSRKI